MPSAAPPGHSGIALVTGAAQGIGRACALRLAADGHTVAVNDVTDDGRLSELAERIGGIAAPADIADPDAVAAMLDRLRRLAGPVEVLVANAATMSMGPFLDQKPDDWWHQIEVNLSGHFRVVQAVLPGMRALGHGRIVVIASEWGVIGQRNATAYAASKAGLIALAKGLARELGPQGIRTNCVAPSYVDTDQLRVDAADAGVTLEELRARYRRLMPVGRLAEPADIAATVAFLASPGAGAITGQTLQPNGGSTRARA
ncbi:SDR family NAD(P)-dependent oxidoreductase [Streptomyces collinus]|uniref:SDR family NAD(P)-dependent oxidoreductase n=1 Tax=Streptomyces collinus TaxID=42684 RepID=UPI0037FEE8C0